MMLTNHLVNRFNGMIQRLVEHGIVAYLKEENKRILRSKGYREKKLIWSSVDSVSVHEVQPIFLILLIGSLLAVFSLLVEYVIVAYTTKLQNNLQIQFA